MPTVQVRVLNINDKITIASNGMIKKINIAVSKRSSARLNQCVRVINHLIIIMPLIIVNKITV